MKSVRLQLNPDFPDLVARAGLSQRAFARRTGVSFSTIMGLVHPDIHPGRRGGMQRRTAWLIANAYADLAGIDADVAFRTLIVEHHPEPATDHPRAEGSLHGSS
jgi:transcriptional regulator with XRE-family HTH domain